VKYQILWTCIIIEQTKWTRKLFIEKSKYRTEIRGDKIR